MAAGTRIIPRPCAGPASHLLRDKLKRILGGTPHTCEAFSGTPRVSRFCRCLARFLYRRHDLPGSDRGFVDFGADRKKGVADGVGDRGGRATAPPSPMPFMPYSVCGVGVCRWPILIPGISAALGNK